MRKNALRHLQSQLMTLLNQNLNLGIEWVSHARTRCRDTLGTAEILDTTHNRNLEILDTTRNRLRYRPTLVYI